MFPNDLNQLHPIYQIQGCRGSVLKGATQKVTKTSIIWAARHNSYLQFLSFGPSLLPVQLTVALALLSAISAFDVFHADVNKCPHFHMHVCVQQCWTSNIAQHQISTSASCWVYIIDLTTCVFVCCFQTEGVFYFQCVRVCVCVCTPLLLDVRDMKVAKGEGFWTRSF